VHRDNSEDAVANC